MTGVSYRSGGESATAVLSKAVDATFENIAILAPLIRDGKLRALAVQNATRTPLLPNVPTMAEAGVPNCEANTFFGLVAPAHTPAAIVERINAIMNAGMQAPEIHSKIVNIGTEAKPGTPADFAAYIAAQNRKWVEVGKAANIKLH